MGAKISNEIKDELDSSEKIGKRTNKMLMMLLNWICSQSYILSFNLFLQFSGSVPHSAKVEAMH